jgi:hypothetical protein
MASRAIMRIDLTKEAIAQLDELIERQGMTKVAVVSRLIEWLHKQPPELQHKIMIDWERPLDLPTVKKILEMPVKSA